MTVFPDGTKERLHGHNYTLAVAIDLDRIDLEAMIPFDQIKGALADLSAEWKERVMVAQKNPHLAIVRDDTELEFTLCGARYVLPRDEALLLPIDNISVEALAAHAAAILFERISVVAAPYVRAFEVTIEENPGQGASCTIDLR
jgi:6-pyruvoyltetrahydropterin/6-carboxytetrahydropterin synthase